MNRRGFLGTLLGLAAAPFAAKAAPKIEWSGALQAGVVNSDWYAIIHPAVEEQLSDMGMEIGTYRNIRWVTAERLNTGWIAKQDPQWYRAFAK